MAPPALKHPERSPFLRHRLQGWEPTIPHIRYPVTFGLYREGGNLGLFLAPADLAGVRRAMDLPGSDKALVFTGAQVLEDAFLSAPEPAYFVPWSSVDRLDGEVDVIHLPESADLDPEELAIVTPVLACPELAVPTDLGSRVTLGLNDSCHVAVISPDPELIKRCLNGFIQDYLSSAVLQDVPMPTLPDALIEELLEPLAPGAWQELMLHTRRSYWTLDIHRHGSDTAPIRWVCEGAGGRWRGGWAW